MSGVTTQKATTFPIQTTVPTTATTLKKTTNPIETGSPSPTTNTCEPPGPINSRDILEGSCISITCSGGCIEIVKVLLSCSMSDGFSEKQKDFVAGICDGKEKCVVKADYTFFGEPVQSCSKPSTGSKLWIKLK